MSSYFDDAETCELSRDGFMDRVKSPIIWLGKGNAQWPICYLTKPRFVSDEDFNKFLDGFTFQITKRHESKYTKQELATARDEYRNEIQGVKND